MSQISDRKFQELLLSVRDDGFYTPVDAICMNPRQYRTVRTATIQPIANRDDLLRGKMAEIGGVSTTDLFVSGEVPEDALWGFKTEGEVEDADDLIENHDKRYSILFSTPSPEVKEVKFKPNDQPSEPRGSAIQAGVIDNSFYDNWNSSGNGEVYRASFDRECPDCEGRGIYKGLHKVEDPCKTCNGEGTFSGDTT